LSSYPDEESLPNSVCGVQISSFFNQIRGKNTVIVYTIESFGWKLEDVLISTTKTHNVYRCSHYICIYIHILPWEASEKAHFKAEDTRLQGLQTPAMKMMEPLTGNMEI